MVLCPDVCEANWAKTEELVVLSDNAAKQATVLYKKVSESADASSGPCKSKVRLLIEMEDRLLCLLCAFLISYCLPARRGVCVEGKVLWI